MVFFLTSFSWISKAPIKLTHSQSSQPSLSDTSADERYNGQHHFAGYRFVGRLENIDLGSKPIRLKFKNLKKSAYGHSEEVKLCDINENTVLTMELDWKMHFYQEAQKSKQKLDVSINNLFDRCAIDITSAKN